MQEMLYQDHQWEEVAAQSGKKNSDYLLFLRPSQIHVPYLYREKKVNRNALIRLSDSIKRYGLLEPLSVREIASTDGAVHYELLEDEHRWQAACLAGMARIPCTISPTTALNDEIEAIFAQIQQKTSSIFEQATAFQVLIEEHGLTQGEVARRAGMSQSAVANKLRLLQFSDEERQSLLKHELSERHARALLRLKDPEMRKKAIEIVHSEHFTVAQTEEWVETLLFSRQENRYSGEPQKEMPSLPDIRPRKFVMQSLQPLYNSIDKALSIFQKTGKVAEMERKEGSDGVKITIRIPK